jgi:septum formation protein
MAESVVLASASPARAQLLFAAGLEICVEPALVDEEAIKRAFRAEQRLAVDCALALAEAKARLVAGRDPHAFVVGADQILVCGGRWFDKPLSLDDAFTQLRILRGRTHELVTAACVVWKGDLIWHTVSSAELTMRNFGDAFLDAYVGAEGLAVVGSVGAYRLEGRGVQLFSHIKGDYFAILGLPLIELLGCLRDRGALPG